MTAPFQCICLVCICELKILVILVSFVFWKIFLCSWDQCHRRLGPLSCRYSLPSSIHHDLNVSWNLNASQFRVVLSIGDRGAYISYHYYFIYSSTIPFNAVLFLRISIQWNAVACTPFLDAIYRSASRWAHFFLFFFLYWISICLSFDLTWVSFHIYDDAG